MTFPSLYMANICKYRLLYIVMAECLNATTTFSNLFHFSSVSPPILSSYQNGPEINPSEESAYNNIDIPISMSCLRLL